MFSLNRLEPRIPGCRLDRSDTSAIAPNPRPNITDIRLRRLEFLLLIFLLADALRYSAGTDTDAMWVAAVFPYVIIAIYVTGRWIPYLGPGITPIQKP